MFGKFAFALEDVDVDAGLIVDAGGVKLLGAGRNCGIARNDFCDGAAVSLDAEGERRDVEQQHGFYALVEDIGLNGSAEGDDFVGIQLDVRLAAEKLFDRAADQGRASGAADENDFVHVRGLEMGVGESLLDGAHGALDDGANEGIKRTASEIVREYSAVRQSEAKSGRFAD